MYIFLDKRRLIKMDKENIKTSSALKEDSSYTKFVNNKVYFNEL